MPENKLAIGYDVQQDLSQQEPLEHLEYHEDPVVTATEGETAEETYAVHEEADGRFQQDITSLITGNILWSSHLAQFAKKGTTGKHFYSLNLLLIYISVCLFYMTLALLFTNHGSKTVSGPTLFTVKSDSTVRRRMLSILMAVINMGRDYKTQLMVDNIQERLMASGDVAGLKRNISPENGV